MAKPRRNVQFFHRGGNNTTNGRRASVSEISEAASEPGSPTKSGLNGKAEVSKEEVSLSLCNDPVGINEEGDYKEEYYLVRG